MRSIRNKKTMKLLVIIILLILLAGTIGAYYLLNGHDEASPYLVYDDFDLIGGKLADNTYYLLGANNDIAFEVTKENNFSYTLTDSEGNKVDSQILDGNPAKIKGPATLYEDGKTYELEITNGKFVYEKYRDVKKIIFKVSRPAKQTMTFKDNVIKVDKKDIQINDNAIKSDAEYKENDIILVYDGEKLLESYKIDKVNDHSYQYSIPKNSDVFSDLDYYGKEKVNLADFVNDKDFNPFLSSLIHTVYAKEEVTVNKPVWNKKDGTLEVGISVYTSDKKEFLANHDAKVELTLVLTIDLYKDIMLDDYNYVLEINYDIKVKNNLNYSNEGFKNLYDAIKFKDNVSDYDTSWLENNYSYLTADKKTINKSFGKMTIETEVPGLYIDVDLGVLMDLNSKGFLNTSLTGKNSLLVGVNSEKGIYSYYHFDNKSEVNFAGDYDNKIGGSINTKLNFMNTFKMSTRMNAGLYTDGKSEMKVNKEEKQTNIDYNIVGKSGFFAKYLVELDKEEKIYDDKIELAKYEKKAKISSKVKEEEKKEEEKPKDDEPTYKYTKEQVRELLQNGYDSLAQNEAWTQVMGTITTNVSSQKTIDVANNTLTGSWTYDGSVTYTCTYNYVTKGMSCNNFTEAQNHVKNNCDTLYNDYLNYLETGEIENEDAMEWEELYTDINACYYEAIPSSEPTSFEEDIQNIINQTELSNEDLAVLKGE